MRTTCCSSCFAWGYFVQRCVLALLLVLWMSAQCNADAILSAPSSTLEAGARFDVRLTITNPTAETLRFELASPLHVTLDAGKAVTTLELTSDELTKVSSSALAIAPGAFRTISLHGEMPDGVSGPATLTLTGLEANALLLQAGTTAAGSGRR
jgi:hypothetical protein